MRIGFFSDSYFPEIDGVTYTLKTWKEWLEERGHEVYIIYPESEEYRPGKREIPVKSFSNPFYSGYNIPVPTSLDFPDLDIVHCHSPGPVGWAGMIYGRRKDLKLVYTHHTPLEEYFIQAVKFKPIADFLGKIYVPLEKFFLSQFNKVTSNTDEGRRNLDMTELPVGVDMQFFSPEEADWDLERPVAGYSGRISNEKNLDKILEMAEIFSGTVVIVGEGPEKERLEKKAPENVVFKNFLDRDRLPEFYSMLDVFVTSSTGDTLGLSTLEANACGTPVVAADTFPFNQTIEEGLNGERFELEDTEEFRQKIREAISKEYRTRNAVNRYSVEKTLDRLEKIYGEDE